MKSQAPILSFIVPIYNVSDYLSICLKSILGQSENNIEIILIDDGSMDDSLQICREFAAHDSRIFIYEQSNQGQGVARNRGIDLSTGKYIAFVDPDDWLDPEMVRISVSAMDNDQSDFLNYRIQFMHHNGKKGYSLPLFNQRSLNGNKIYEYALTDDQIYSSPCNKVYRRSILVENKIRFPAIRAYEDLVFSKLLAKNSIKCTFINNILYYALIRMDSTSRKVTANNFDLAIKVVRLESEVLLIPAADGHVQSLFSAHVRKFFAGALLKAALIGNDKTLFFKYAQIVNNIGNLYTLNLAGFFILSRRSQAAIVLTLFPRLTWWLGRLMAIMGFRSY